MHSSTPITSPWEYLRYAPFDNRGASYVISAALRSIGGSVAVIPDALVRYIHTDILQELAGQAIVIDQTASDEHAALLATQCAELLQQGGIVVLTASALLAVGDTPVSGEAVQYARGQTVPMDEIVAYLESRGYERAYQVEAEGEWTRRGGVLDIWPPGAKLPLRLDFFGDQIERIRRFDAASQLSHATAEVARIPALKTTTGEDQKTLWHWCRNAGAVVWESEQCLRFWAAIDGWDIHRANELISGCEIAQAHGSDDRCREFELPPALSGSSKFPLEPRFLALRRLLHEGRSVWVSVPSERHYKGLRQLAEPYSIRMLPEPRLPTKLPGDEKPSIYVHVGPALPSVYVGDKLVMIDEADIVQGGAYRQQKRPQSAKQSNIALGELEVGDIVVHNEYGVGRYDGLICRNIDGIEHDFLKVGYEGNNAVFLPVDRIYLLEKLQSGTEETKLDKLGSNRFAKRKAKAKDDALLYANTLLASEAARSIAETEVLPEPGKMCTALSLSFGYTLTPDQDRSIEDIFASMASGKAMDRLLVGDVGFGKTEVAIRAVGYAVENSLQAVILAPTTILAYQHARLFVERMGPLGIRVGYVNRFRSSQDNSATMRSFANGELDVLVGTHRVLQRDFHAPRLGLIIVDEEHKFGILQKEKLSSLRQQAHRLSMSATPIPRSLNLALSGRREISTIVTPPPSRQSVETNVVPIEQELGRAVLMRELDRKGQVYVVAPHIADLEDVADTIRSWAPDARIAVGHGQMGGKEMETLFLDFWEYNIDVLISTSIVESGLDVGNANTMIIWNGHKFGLADLYQLRGRVGRSDAKGYCYIVVPLAQKLTPQANKRLEIIERFSKLGSGYQIATYDLEIRGAGELLGKKQSGHVQTIGMGLYARLLEEAIAEAQDQPLPHLPEPDVRTWFSTSIAQEIRLSDSERIEIYRQLFSVENRTEFDERSKYICDRYNLQPEDLAQIGWAAMARGYARTLGLSMLDWRKNEVRMALHPESGLDRGELVEVAISLNLRLTPDSFVVEFSGNAKHAEPTDPEAAWGIMQGVLAKLSRLIKHPAQEEALDT